MKKITVVSLVSFVFLFVCSVVAKLTMHAFNGYKAPLIIGVSILAVSGIIALIVRDNPAVNILCSVISAVAMGFIIRSWYILRGLENSILVMTLISLGAVLYLWVYFALIRLPVVRESSGVTVAVTALYAIISIVIYTVLALNTKTNFVSTVGYYAILEFSFIFAMSFEVNDNRELIRNLTLSTYSVFIVAIIVAVFALMAAAGGGDCDCDCGGCDCNCGGYEGGSGKEGRASTRKERAARRKELRRMKKYSKYV